jgi:hypothetical protein
MIIVDSCVLIGHIGAELARERKQRPSIRPAEPTPAQRGTFQRVLELVQAAR